MLQSKRQLNLAMPKNSREVYLKKYLSGSKNDRKQEKKKKHKSTISSRVKIIDDDGDLSKRNIDDEDIDLILTGEDAPQIVGVIDDRPPELKTVEDFRKSGKWKSVCGDRYDSHYQKHYDNGKFDSRISKDCSPKRKRKGGYDEDFISVKKSDDYDFSSSRKKFLKERGSYHLSPSSTTVHERDLNSNRKRMEDSDPKFSQNKEYISRKMQNYGEHLSKEESSDQDLNPIRKSRREETFDKKLSRKQFHDKDLQSHKTEKSHNFRDLTSRKERESDERHFSPHKNLRRYEKHSPPRKRDSTATIIGKRDYDRRSLDERKSIDLSPKRKKRGYEQNIDQKIKKTEVTLDGKRAGLQDAKMLRYETEAFRKKENELFKNMSDELSGKTKEVVVRQNSRHRTKDYEEERKRERKKLESEKKIQETYNRWGKGLKQIEEQEKNLKYVVNEMNKPLARYSDDIDLDNMLKGQEREGDPMLNYIRQKQQKDKNESGVLSIPTYNGPFPENRFGIRPGYRWDGVDRSNGYEKKWFDVQNQKKAIQEEAYKYSTEDM